MLLGIGTATLDILGLASVYLLISTFLGLPIEEQPSFLSALSLLGRTLLGSDPLVGSVAIFAIAESLFAVADYLRRVYSENTSWKLKHDVNLQEFQRYLDEDLSSAVHRERGDVTFRVITFPTIVAETFLGASQFLVAAIKTLVIFMFFMSLDLWVSVGVIAFCGVFMAVSYAGARFLTYEWGAAKAQSRTEQAGLIDEVIEGILQIRLYGNSQRWIDSFQRANELFARMLKRLVTLSSLPNHLGTIASAGIVTLVVWLAAADDARLGAYLPLIATFYLGTQRLLPSVAEIVQEGMKIASNAAVLSDYQVSKPAPIRSHPVPSSDPLVAGTLAFDSLTLRYGDRGAALNDVSLEIPIGKTTVVLGPSGSGKSSLLNILLGLNEPTEGNVLINGLPLRTLPLRAWRAAIGFVPQEPFFFYGTIRANIDFGRGVSSESVETAARLADAEGFIKDLPNGFETILGERGHGLSGGEAQRICIARALIGSPALLVLDEPTSSLDRLSERAVLDSLRALSGHYTLIVVTHRTELVRAADQIVVMKDGSITALGTHQHLMKAHSDYQGLIGDSIKQDESKETRDGGARRR